MSYRACWPSVPGELAARAARTASTRFRTWSVHHGEEQVVLACEIGVDRTLRQACGRGDLVQAGAGEACSANTSTAASSSRRRTASRRGRRIRPAGGAGGRAVPAGLRAVRPLTSLIPHSILVSIQYYPVLNTSQYRRRQWRSSRAPARDSVPPPGPLSARRHTGSAPLPGDRHGGSGAPPAPDGAQHARRWATLAVVCAAALIINVDNTILNVALPTLVRDLHATYERAAVDRRLLRHGLRRAAARRRQPG